jgi:hypothetical protein
MDMRYPQLVPNWVCTTPITLYLEGEGVDEDGAPVSVAVKNAKCNWQDGGKVLYSDTLKTTEISGKAYFNGDIAPTLSNIVSGEAVVFGEKREIHQGFKRRNPDGTVNHTEIQFK